MDLRGPHPADPPDVSACRAQEERIMLGWLQEFEREQQQL